MTKDHSPLLPTHSPILLAYIEAEIYTVTETDNGLELTKHEDAEQYILTKYFISNYAQVIKDLVNDTKL